MNRDDVLKDIDRRLREIENENRVRLRKGVVKGTSPIVLQLGGDCDAPDISGVPSAGPVDVDAVVPVLESNGTVVILPAFSDGDSATWSFARQDSSGHVLVPTAGSAANHAIRKDTFDLVASLLNAAIGSNGSDITTLFGLVSALGATAGKIPAVSSLPSSPTDGQTVHFQEWICRYDSSPPFASYPWQVIGGLPRAASNDSNVFVLGGSYYTPSGAMTITLPAGVRGIFDLSIGGYIDKDDGNCRLSYSVGGTAASSDWAAINGGGEYQDMTTYREYRHTINDAGSGSVTITEKHSAGGGSPDDGNIQYRRMTAMPLYIHD